MLNYVLSVIVVVSCFVPTFACMFAGIAPSSVTAFFAGLWLVVGLIVSLFAVPLSGRVLHRVAVAALVAALVFGGACVASARPAFVDAEWGVVRHASGVAVGDQLTGWRALGARVAASRSPYGGGLLVLDIDECVLDNTPAEAGLCLRYSVPSWNDWCSRVSASAVPGAVPVVRAAVASGWRVAFVSARGSSVLMATIANLALAGLPVDLGDVGVFCVGSSRRKPAVFGRLLDVAAFSLSPVVFGGDQVGDAPRASYAGFGWSAFTSLPNWMY